MSDDLKFFINESTIQNMFALKKQTGFGEKNWDEWFNHVLNLNNDIKPIQNVIEKTMEKFHLESFDEWVQNFSLNLNNIWNEPSARELQPTTDSQYNLHKHSAIVIGRGPSVKKHRHLELIANSDYKGSIVCTDGALINALKAGVTPEKFPNFYVVTIEPRDVVKKFYDDEIVDQYGPKINGIFSTISKPSNVERARQAGIKIHWLHSLFDYEAGNKSFNKIAGLMVRSKNHSHGLPAIQTGGNVGTSSWFVSWQILKCSTVALIGINHAWDEDDPWELITSHGRSDVSLNLDRNNPNFQKLFPKVYNPEFKCTCILDPLFQFYSAALKEFISRSPSWLTTINSTEGGCIFGEKIHCMLLTEFLNNHKN